MAPRPPRGKETPAPHTTTGETHPFDWIQLAIFLGAAVWYAVASKGAYHDDDLDHYFMARAALRQPEFFLNPWGRPAFTVLYALPAQFGFTAIRIATALIATITGWVTLRAARALNFRLPGLAAGLA